MEGVENRTRQQVERMKDKPREHVGVHEWQDQGAHKAGEVSQAELQLFSTSTAKGTWIKQLKFHPLFCQWSRYFLNSFSCFYRLVCWSVGLKRLTKNGFVSFKCFFMYQHKKSVHFWKPNQTILEHFRVLIPPEMEHFRTLKLTLFEHFRVLKLTALLEQFRALKCSICGSFGTIIFTFGPKMLQ